MGILVHFSCRTLHETEQSMLTRDKEDRDHNNEHRNAHEAKREAPAEADVGVSNSKIDPIRKEDA